MTLHEPQFSKWHMEQAQKQIERADRLVLILVVFVLGVYAVLCGPQ